ncbi:B-cell receptor CD22-like [Engraulis encrasicolus]|uniref:B-cell receptor CD22-like n=1 Tax=Engraulis encrasicolus TaxID=184585 RepID=UPI002FD590E3
MHEESTILVFLLLISPGVSDPEWKVTLTPNKCAPLNSLVDIGCSYEYPIGYRPVKTYWIVNDTEPLNWKDFSNVNTIERLGYLGDKNKNCTLRITDVRNSDAGAYRFRFQTDKSDGRWASKSPFTLSVTALQVVMSPATVTEGQSVTLTCDSSCPPKTNPTYIWCKLLECDLHSSERMIDEEDNDDQDDEFDEDDDDDDEDEDDDSALQVVMSPATVTEGQSVTLTCRPSCDPGGHSTFIWYRNRQHIANQHKTFTISPVKSTDSGSYSCAVQGHEHYQSPAKTLVVQYPPKKTSVSISPAGKVVEGDSVTLTCSSDANPPVHTYTWYKTTQGVNAIGSGQTYNFNNISSEHTGQYYCRGTNRIGYSDSLPLNLTVFCPGTFLRQLACQRVPSSRSCSKDAFVDIQVEVMLGQGFEHAMEATVMDLRRCAVNHQVIQLLQDCLCLLNHAKWLLLGQWFVCLDPPKKTSASTSPPGDIFEGDSVTLTCSSDANPPVHTYTWYKINSGETAIVSGQNYDITNITTEDTGHYYCKVENSVGFNNSTALSIDVLSCDSLGMLPTPPKNTLLMISPPKSSEDSVTLACHSDANPPVHTYTWFKKTDSGPALPHATRNISRLVLLSGDEGFYYCVVHNQYGSQYSPNVEVTFQVVVRCHMLASK